VNALSDTLVWRWRATEALSAILSRAANAWAVQPVGDVQNRRGTKIRFHPDPQIFGPKAQFDPGPAVPDGPLQGYLFGGVEIRWTCAPELLRRRANARQGALPLSRRLKDYLARR
jgi:topoisomerase-4 subunit B